MFGQMTKKATTDVEKYFEEFLQRKDPIIQAEALIGKVDQSTFSELEKEFNTGLDNLAVQIKKEFIDLWDIVGGSEPAPGAFNKYMTEVDLTLQSLLVNMKAGFANKTQDVLTQALQEGISDIGETGPLIGFEIDLVGLRMAGVETEKLLELRKDLKQEEQGRLGLLNAQLETQIGINREATTRYAQIKRALSDTNNQLEKEKEILAALEAERDLSNDKTKSTVLVGKQNKVINDLEFRRLALSYVLNRTDKLRVAALTKMKDLLDEISEVEQKTVGYTEKLVLGLEAGVVAFAKAATDFMQIANDLSTTILEGLATAISNAFTAIFIKPTEEIEGIKQQLKELEKEKEDVAKKMKLIEVGGVLPEQIDEYNQLRNQWEEINVQIKDANKNLNDVTSTSKRVADAFREFGQSILKTLSDMISKLIVYNMLMAIGSSVGGGDWLKGLGLGDLIEMKKGGLVKGGFSPLSSDTIKLLKSMNTKFFASGGVAGGPTLGVVGEGRNAEAVVPLPDNKSIPVTFTGDKTRGTTQDIKIVNLLDPKMIPSLLLQYPDAVINIINSDIIRRGPIYQLLRSVK
jgi:hypothetical protein